MADESPRLSSRTVIVLIVFLAMIPLSVFYLFAYDEIQIERDEYPTHIFWLTYSLSFFTSFALIVTYSIDEAYKKELHWFLKKWRLSSYIIVQALCLGLGFLLLMSVVNASVMKSSWDWAISRYTLDSKMPVEHIHDFTFRMKNYYPLEKPPIIFPASVVFLNIIIFVVLIIYSSLYDSKKIHFSELITELDAEKNGVHIEEISQSTLPEPEATTSKAVFERPLLLPRPLESTLLHSSQSENIN